MYDFKFIQNLNHLYQLFVLLGLMKLHLTLISLSISWLIVLTQSWQVSLRPQRKLFCTALSVLLSPYQTQPLSQALTPRLWCYIYREHKSSQRAISILSTQRSKVHSITLRWQTLVPYTLLCCQARWRGCRCPSALQKAAAMWWYMLGALFWLLLLRWSQALYFFWLRIARSQMVSGSTSTEYFSQIITHQCMRDVRVWLFSFVNTSVQVGDSRWRPLIVFFFEQEYWMSWTADIHHLHWISSKVCRGFKPACFKHDLLCTHHFKTFVRVLLIAIFASCSHYTNSAI